MSKSICGRLYETKSNGCTLGVDAAGGANELYQLGKNSLLIYGASVMIGHAGESGNEDAMQSFKGTLQQYSNQLSTMPLDTPIDFANNHRGAEIASTTNNWSKLVKKIADSSSFAISNSGKGK